jgi:hypothetical protein
VVGWERNSLQTWRVNVKSYNQSGTLRTYVVSHPTTAFISSLKKKKKKEKNWCASQVIDID